MAVLKNFLACVAIAAFLACKPPTIEYDRMQQLKGIVPPPIWLANISYTTPITPEASSFSFSSVPCATLILERTEAPSGDSMFKARLPINADGKVQEKAYSGGGQVGMFTSWAETTPYSTVLGLMPGPFTARFLVDASGKTKKVSFLELLMNKPKSQVFP
jgi:hypothetical protein